MTGEAHVFGAPAMVTYSRAGPEPKFFSKEVGVGNRCTHFSHLGAPPKARGMKRRIVADGGGVLAFGRGKDKIIIIINRTISDRNLADGV